MKAMDAAPVPATKLMNLALSLSIQAVAWSAKAVVFVIAYIPLVLISTIVGEAIDVRRGK
jgi:hypothetical protein